MSMNDLFTARRLWLLMALGCAGLVIASVILTNMLHLHPCYLCVFQRLMFLLMTGFGLGAALLRSRPLRIASSSLFLLSATAGASVAAFQVWLQAQPGAEYECSGGDPNMIELLVRWLDAHVPVLFVATGNCASKELVIFGISLAGWSLVCFIVSLPVAIWALRSGMRQGHAA